MDWRILELLELVGSLNPETIFKLYKYFNTNNMNVA